MLSVAAVIGREFDIDLLATVSERSEDELLELLEGAVASSVLAESARAPGRFSFAHALINPRYMGSRHHSPCAASRPHRRSARGAAGLRTGSARGRAGAPLGGRHDHRRLGTCGGLRPEGGTAWALQLAPDEASGWFRQALDLIEAQADPAVAMRCDALIGLGESERQVGDADFRETLLTAARLALEAGDLERLTAAVLANNRGRTSVYGLVDSERVELIEAALERMTAEDPSRVRACCRCSPWSWRISRTRRGGAPCLMRRSRSPARRDPQPRSGATRPCILHVGPARYRGPAANHPGAARAFRGGERPGAPLLGAVLRH